jgi:nucleolar GTP-binding protein
MDGRNVMDFWSPDIEAKLVALERDEIARLRREILEQEQQTEDIPQITPEQMEKVRRIREKRSIMIQKHRLRRGANDSRLPIKYATDREKTLSSFEKHLSDLGLDGSEVVDRIRERSRSRSRSLSVSRARSESRARSDISSRDGSRSRSESRSGRKRSRSELDSRGFSASRASVQSKAFKTPEQRSKADRLAKRARRSLSRTGRKAESDRSIPNLKPKHLFSGKRGIGKTDRR